MAWLRSNELVKGTIETVVCGSIEQAQRHHDDEQLEYFKGLKAFMMVTDAEYPTIDDWMREYDAKLSVDANVAVKAESGSDENANAGSENAGVAAEGESKTASAGSVDLESDSGKPGPDNGSQRRKSELEDRIDGDVPENVELPSIAQPVNPTKRKPRRKVSAKDADEAEFRPRGIHRAAYDAAVDALHADGVLKSKSYRDGDIITAVLAVYADVELGGVSDDVLELIGRLRGSEKNAVSRQRQELREMRNMLTEMRRLFMTNVVTSEFVAMRLLGLDMQENPASADDVRIMDRDQFEAFHARMLEEGRELDDLSKRARNSQYRR